MTDRREPTGRAGRRLTAVLLAGGLLLGGSVLLGCTRPGGSAGSGSSGSGSNTGTDGSNTGAGGSNTGGSNNQPPRRKYSWTLPVGDVSPNENEMRVYDEIRQGRCAAAQGLLDEGWARFASPRNVLLAQAGVEFCQNDVASATQLFRQAERYGWSGLVYDDGKPRAACELYRSAASVIQQRDRGEFRCPAGDPPEWDVPEPERSSDPRDGVG